MPPSKRPDREADLNRMRRIIRNKFADKPFTCADIIHEVYLSFSKSRHGFVRHDLIKLSKEGFIRYSMGKRKTGGKGKWQEDINYGAIYRYNIPGIAVGGPESKEKCMKVKL